MSRQIRRDRALHETPPPTPKTTYRAPRRQPYAIYRTPAEGEGKGLSLPLRLTDLSVVAAPALLAASAIFLLLAFWQWRGYQKTEEEYQSLRSGLVWVSTSESGETPVSRLDFAGLQTLNPDTTAWLSIPGLDISLPVVQNEDSNYYLRRSFSGESSNEGCLIRPSWDEKSWLEGLCHVIHGHNIHTGAMFGNLDSYRDEDFFDSNPTFTLYTPEGDFLCRIFSVHDALADDPCYALNYSAGEDYDNFLRYLQELSLYDTEVDVPSGSRILTLSTCRSSYISNNQRFVVHAVMEQLIHGG